jgi:hypothetical protein
MSQWEQEPSGFVFLDSKTVVFGSHGLLERMISAHEFKEENLFQDVTLAPLINQASSDGIFWAVLDSDATHSVM